MDDDAEEAPPRARRLLEQIDWLTESLRRTGAAVPVLPETATAVLRTAAAGKPVDAAQLVRALAAAERLDSQLSWEFLKRPPSLS
jgi:hypothetical protein